MPTANITGNRVNLEFYNSSVVGHVWGTGQLGYYKRDVSNTYTAETFMTFNTSVIPIGSTVDSCTLDVTMSGGTPPSGSVDGIIYENNRSNPSAWLPSAPDFDDFSSNTWADDSSEKSVLNSPFTGSSYTWPTAAGFVTMVDNWVQTTKDWNWGCILSSNFGFFSYFRNVDSVTLNVTYTAPQLSKTDYYYQLNKKRKIS